jgi:hypothetical protein
MQQRSIPPAAIEAAFLYGTPIRQPGGRIAWHIGRREAKLARAAGCDLPRLEGVTVVEAPDGALVTVIRSPDRARLEQHGRPCRGRRG